MTADVRALAQRYGESALETLNTIMVDVEQPAAARVSAAKELLDRAYGKSPQPLAVNTGNLAQVFSDLMEKLPA